MAPKAAPSFASSSLIEPYCSPFGSEYLFGNGVAAAAAAAAAQHDEHDALENSVRMLVDVLSVLSLHRKIGARRSSQDRDHKAAVRVGTEAHQVRSLAAACQLLASLLRCHMAMEVLLR